MMSWRSAMLPTILKSNRDVSNWWNSMAVFTAQENGYSVTATTELYDHLCYICHGATMLELVISIYLIFID